MNLSKLIKILQAAKKNYGDVPVKLIDSESGDYVLVKEVIKLHPFTTGYGFMNRGKPVNSIAICSNTSNAEDLVLN